MRNQHLWLRILAPLRDCDQPVTVEDCDIKKYFLTTVNGCSWEISLQWAVCSLFITLLCWTNLAVLSAPVFPLWSTNPPVRQWCQTWISEGRGLTPAGTGSNQVPLEERGCWMFSDILWVLFSGLHPPFFLLLLSFCPAVARAGKPGPCVCLQAIHGNSAFCGRLWLCNEQGERVPACLARWADVQPPDLISGSQKWEGRRWFSLLPKSQRCPRRAPAFTTPGCKPGVSSSCTGAAAGLQGCSLPGYWSVCEPGSSCRGGMGWEDALEALKKCWENILEAWGVMGLCRSWADHFNSPSSYSLFISFRSSSIFHNFPVWKAYYFLLLLLLFSKVTQHLCGRNAALGRSRHPCPHPRQQWWGDVPLTEGCNKGYK